jgi:hypothetical protein
LEGEMERQDFLRIFTEHVKILQKYYIRQNVIHTIKTTGCPFNEQNLKFPPEPEEVTKLKQTEKFMLAGGHYIFHPQKSFREKLLEIIEKEWREEV